jgi:hypothetical protein
LHVTLMRKITIKRGYLAAARAAYERALERSYGSQGAASPVRKIDPVTGKVIAILELRRPPRLECRHRRSRLAA